MKKHEELYAQICDNFYNEINPLLMKIDNSCEFEYWFDKKDISGKFFIIKDLSLALTENNIDQHLLVSLKDILHKYRLILSNYFNSNNIATGFIYFAPENNKAIREYFYNTDFQIDYFTLLGVCHIYCVGIDMIGFPNDCSFKLTAYVKNNELKIEKKQDPLFSIEEERGKLIAAPQRSRSENHRIEEEIRKNNSELWKKGEARAKEYFNVFASKIKARNENILNDFSNCIDLCISLQQSIEKKTFANYRSDIEKIYSALKDSYFDVSFETFLNVFSPLYEGEKITWLKTGPELKYFIDNLKSKFSLSTNINSWANDRFEMKKPVSNMALYLGKQTSKGEYQLLMQRNLRRNPIFKLFEE